LVVEGVDVPNPQLAEDPHGSDFHHRDQHFAPPQSVLIIGETAVARRVCATLADELSSPHLIHFIAPTDDELGSALTSDIRGAAVLIRDDVSALRYAFAIAHLNHGLPMVVTIFDKTIAEQLRTFLPQASVISTAALAAPSLVGPCVGEAVLACFTTNGLIRHVIRQPGGLVTVRERGPNLGSRLGQFLCRAWPDIRHQPPGSRLLTLGLLGILSVLLVDWSWLVLIEGHEVLHAFVDAARVVATVGPAGDYLGAGYAAFSGTAMLLTILFAALFTAGVAERLVSPPFAAIVGRRAVPRRGHVIVVGMGQVGIRLCDQLRRQGIPVVGVERNSQAPLLSLARTLRIPVVVGQGTDRRMLERLHVSRCRALAAVASDDLDNVAVAVSAAAVSPATRVVLRTGEHEAIEETRSLLPIGVTRDVTAMATAFVVAHFRDHAPKVIVADANIIYAERGDGSLAAVRLSRRVDCCHQ
jgi:hypothetical protein